MPVSPPQALKDANGTTEENNMGHMIPNSIISELNFLSVGTVFVVVQENVLSPVIHAEGLG